MDDKLQKKVNETIDTHADELHDQRLETHTRARRDRALMVSGGLRAAMNISRMIGSELMRGLERFQAEECWRDLEYDSFAEYLKSPESPMSKGKYYELKTLLDKEGDEIFDLYGNLGLKPRIRRLLGTGQVELEGDTIIVKNDDGEETRIEKNDWTRVAQVITASVDDKILLQSKLDKQAENLKKADDRIREAHAETDRIRASKVAEFAADAHMTARVELGLAFNKFIDIAEKLSDTEKAQFRDAVLEQVQGWRNDLAHAYLTGVPHSAVRTPHLEGSTLDEKLDNFLNDIDLDNVDDNDSELADKL